MANTGRGVPDVTIYVVVVTEFQDDYKPRLGPWSSVQAVALFGTPEDRNEYVLGWKAKIVAEQCECRDEWVEEFLCDDAEPLPCPDEEIQLSEYRRMLKTMYQESDEALERAFEEVNEGEFVPCLYEFTFYQRSLEKILEGPEEYILAK